MTPLNPNSSHLALWKGRAPGVAEFSALLNMLPDASLLIDRTRDLIVFVNSALLQMTAFTQDELCGNTIDYLLPGLAVDHMMPGDEHPVQVNRRKRNPIPAVIHVDVLDSDSQWIIITLVPGIPPAQDINKKQEEMFQSLVGLAKLSRYGDARQAFNQSLVLAKTLLDTELICIYQAESNFPRLTKISSIEPVQLFPEYVPSTDLIRLSSMTVWVPGKQVQTEVHRTGRVSNLSYVMSIPLGEEGVFGLLVAGNRDNPPGDQQYKMMEMLGTHISGVLEHFILTDNLKNEIKEQRIRLTICDQIIENTKQGVIILQPDQKIQEINPAAELMLGYADVEVRGQFVENVLIGPDGLPTALENASRGISTHDLGNVTLHRRDGRYFPAHIQIIPVQKNEVLMAMLIFIADVTEYEEIRTRTQQLEHRALVGELTAIFAHEVRNPINNISTGLQLLSSRLANDEVNQELIGRMQGDCTRLNHLMESILAFSRQSETKFESVDLKILLQRILDRWRPRLARVNVTSFFQASENLPKTRGDSRALEQVFTNLISNAIEAMTDTGGTLAIRIALSNVVANRPQIEVTISDSGMGIPDEIKDRIFEPFVSNKAKGTGLGLAITKSIVTAHRGSISLNSFPGGTIFHVYLPAVNGE